LDKMSKKTSDKLISGVSNSTDMGAR
jgi:hypothetical protein